MKEPVIYLSVAIISWYFIGVLVYTCRKELVDDGSFRLKEVERDLTAAGKLLALPVLVTMKIFHIIAQSLDKMLYKEVEESE